MTRDSENFWLMVTNSQRWDFRHYQHRQTDNKLFSFQTVFYQSAYSYCYCECAYKHEYFDYISDTGEIDLAGLGTVVNNIARGECPHAEKVPKEYLATSSVHTDNFIAAYKPLGSVGVNLTRRFTGIFNICPFVNAVLKNNYQHFKKDYLLEIWSYHYRIVDPWALRILFPFGYQGYGNVTWRWFSLFEFCAANKYMVMFRFLLKHALHIQQCNKIAVYDLAYQYNLKDAMDILQHRANYYRFERGELQNWTEIQDIFVSAETAIIHNKTEIMDSIIFQLAANLNKLQKRSLVTTCLVLHRNDYITYFFPQKKKPSLLENLFKGKCLETELEHPSIMQQQFHIRHLIQDHKHSRKIIVSAVQQIPKLHGADLPNEDYLFDISAIDIQTMKMLIALGARLSLTHILNIIKDIRQDAMRNEQIFSDCQSTVRDLLELWFYMNPSLNNSDEDTETDYDIKHTIIPLDYSNNRTGVHHDINRIQWQFIMDGQEHYLFNEEHLVLNFILPLFIECGYKFKAKTLQSIILNEMMQNLHHSDVEYLINCLEQPRSLQLWCRDTLRKYFKDQQIHKYVSISNIPKKIHDFLLLKTVLPTLVKSDIASFLM